ncbi:hypothetical protein C8Q74DRAFT_253143 [Fomes fomentarius]|nr:hypothetical protein C8Q74DRAFT_253143 [Fomes fomentarius]
MRARPRPGHPPPQTRPGSRLVHCSQDRGIRTYLLSHTCARGLPRFARMEGGSARGGISVEVQYPRALRPRPGYVRFDRRYSVLLLKFRSSRGVLRTLCRACACNVGLYMSLSSSCPRKSSELVPAPPSVWETEYNLLKHDLPMHPSQAYRAKSPKCFRACRDCENSPSARAPASPTSIRGEPHQTAGSSRLTRRPGRTYAIWETQWPPPRLLITLNEDEERVGARV